MPQGLAVPADAKHVRAFEEQKRQIARKAQRLREGLEDVKRNVEARSLTLKLNLGEQDTPFGSISVHDIVEALAQDGLNIEKHTVQLDEPIKALGIYEIPIKLQYDVAAKIRLWVTKK